MAKIEIVKEYDAVGHCWIVSAMRGNQCLEYKCVYSDAFMIAAARELSDYYLGTNLGPCAF